MYGRNALLDSDMDELPMEMRTNERKPTASTKVQRRSFSASIRVHVADFSPEEGERTELLAQLTTSVKNGWTQPVVNSQKLLQAGPVINSVSQFETESDFLLLSS